MPARGRCCCGRRRSRPASSGPRGAGFPGAARLGHPAGQGRAATRRCRPAARSRFVSLRLTLAKIGLAVAGFAAGLSIGREGPSVQVAAGVMQHARRWLSPRHAASTRARCWSPAARPASPPPSTRRWPAWCSPSRSCRGRLEARASGLIITAIVLAGLVAVSAFGNLSYFGVIRVPRLGWEALRPGPAGDAGRAACAGGVFSRLLIASLTGAPRAAEPAARALAGALRGGWRAGGGGDRAGHGRRHLRRRLRTVKHMLAGEDELTPLYALLKFVATWLTAWCGVPGGIFAPSLSIGAGIGQNVATARRLGATPPASAPALIAMGMAGFLAAVTQAPLTAFIIVMEMVDGHSMVLSLMASAHARQPGVAHDQPAAVRRRWPSTPGGRGARRRRRRRRRCAGRGRQPKAGPDAVPPRGAPPAAPAS